MHETQNLFLYCHLLILVFFFHISNYKLTLAPFCIYTPLMYIHISKIISSSTSIYLRICQSKQEFIRTAQTLIQNHRVILVPLLLLFNSLFDSEKSGSHYLQFIYLFIQSQSTCKVVSELPIFTPIRNKFTDLGIMLRHRFFSSLSLPVKYISIFFIMRFKLAALIP